MTHDTKQGSGATDIKQVLERATCDGKHGCTNPVTHIGEKGYVYCAGHAACRDRQWERTRKMQVWERKLVESGRPLPRYKRLTKAQGMAVLDEVEA